MNSIKSVRKSILNVFVIGIMVLAGLIAMTNVMVLENGTMPIGGLAPVTQDSPFEVPVTASRGNNSDGDNYVDLYRDVNGDPIFQIDNAAPGVNDVYIGEPNVELDIAVESLKQDNWDDNDGDDVLYNVSVSIDTSSTTVWSSPSCCWVDASSYINWDTDTVTYDYKEDWANTGNILLIDGVGNKEIPWFYNDYGAPEFLDADNNEWADFDEFYLIGDDYKYYNDYQFDVAGNAPAGTYNISVEITYRYQTFQNVTTSHLSGGNDWYDPDSIGPDGTGDLGIFDYYFWEPYNIGSPSSSVNFDDPLNIGIRKNFNYRESAALPSGAYWEGIPDMGYDNDEPDDYTVQANTWDYWSNYDRDGTTSWDDGDPSSNANLTWVRNRWQSGGWNDYTTPFNAWNDRSCDQYPYNVNDGNGTWQYSGYEGDTVWTTYKTEIEYIEFEVEHGVYFSEPWGDNCQLVPDPSTPYYLKAGDQFKKMYTRINNRDGGHHMDDVYVNITLDDNQNFELKHDWAWKSRVNAGNNDDFYYRIDADNGTPVDRYTGNITLTYTREGVRVTETLPFDYICYYTPNLRNYDGPYKPQLQVSEIITNGQDEANVDFSVWNFGNTIMENGILTMDFSDFKHKGEEFTDPEGGAGTYSPRIEVPLLDYDVLDNRQDYSLDVEIPDHWSLAPGVYKLFMDYEGYYFNDGVLGEPTNYVKVWMQWYDEDWNSNTDMNAYCVIDSDNDENMDIFGADETRPIEGIYMYVQVDEFIPTTPCLEVLDVSMNGGTDTIEQGSITNGQCTLTIENCGDTSLTNCEVELDLEGFFTGNQYYDGTNPIVENPTDTIDSLDVDTNDTVTLDIEGIDTLLPPGTHRLTLLYHYNYDNGSEPSETSTDYGQLEFDITVTDSLPDIIATVSQMTQIIRIGDKLVDINLYVDLANREYYSVSNIEATLSVGDDTPFIPGDEETVTGSADVQSRWLNPANNNVPAKGQRNNNMYFNLNLHPDAEEGTYFLDLSIDVFNDRTMTTVVIPTSLEVKIYPKIASLRIVDVSVSTGSVRPGKEFTLEFTIQNDGGEAAREIYIEFKEAYVGGANFIESSEHINPTGAKYPFSSDVLKAYIAEIQALSTGTATYTVVGDLNIYPGVTYFQNMEFDYKDSTGNTHTSTDVVPISSDSSINCKVDGEKYTWDTDRSAWISSDELASEEVMDYTPYWLAVIIVIWLVTFLIYFMFVMRPRYKKEKLSMTETTEKRNERAPKEPEADDEGPEVIDYTTEPDSPYGPAPGPGPDSEQPPLPQAQTSEPVSTPTPVPMAAEADHMLPPPQQPDEPVEELEPVEENSEEENDEDWSDDPPVAKLAEDPEDLPTKGPKKD